MVPRLSSAPPKPADCPAAIVGSTEDHPSSRRHRRLHRIPPNLLRPLSAPPKTAEPPVAIFVPTEVRRSSWVSLVEVTFDVDEPSGIFSHNNQPADEIALALSVIDTSYHF